MDPTIEARPFPGDLMVSRRSRWWGCECPAQPFGDADVECRVTDLELEAIVTADATLDELAWFVLAWDLLDPKYFPAAPLDPTVEDARTFLSALADDAELASRFPDGLFATMLYNIDRPLNLGGNVTWCCVLGRHTACSESARPVACGFVCAGRLPAPGGVQRR